MAPELAALTEAMFPLLRRRRRVVIFCGAGAYAARLADHLHQALPQGKAGSTRQGSQPRVSDEAVAQWREHGGVLIADESAEDGLNLQEADAVVHCRLPWSPNRAGAAHRPRRQIRRGRSSRPAEEFVITSPEKEFAFPGAWLRLLTEGFGVFAGSVSALQDAIESALPEVWEAAVCDGPEGVAGLAAGIAEDMARERKEIDSMDMLESAYESVSGTRDVASSIGELEADWRAIETAVIGYAGDGEGGLRFSWHRTGPRHQARSLRARESRPAYATTTPGTLGQVSAARHDGRRIQPHRGAPTARNPDVPRWASLLRILAAAVAVDDRGQASALWRRIPDWPASRRSTSAWITWQRQILTPLCDC